MPHPRPPVRSSRSAFLSRLPALKFWAGLSIAHSLALSFGLLVLALAGLGALSILRQQEIDAKAQAISAVHLQGVADSLRLAELATRRHSLDYLMAMSERERLPEVEAQLQAVDAELEQLRSRYAAQTQDLTPEHPERRILADAEQALRHYGSLRQGVQAFAKMGASGAAIDLISSEGARRFADARSLLLQLTDLNLQAAQAEAAQAHATYQQSRRQMLGLIAALVLTATLLGWRVTRAITRPLRDVVQLASDVAAGNLSHSTPTGAEAHNTELGRMNRALATMTLRLRDMVEAVRQGVETVSITSTQISSGNQDLSRRTESSAERLHATTLRMSAMAASLRQSQGSAATAARMSAAAAAQAEAGGSAVQQMVQDMGEIRATAHQIGEITGVIDGIARQTNILALNAAIEAARAGAQGKGFAVVAAEVRQLAQRSSQAAQEIKQLIAASVDKAEAGAARAAGAGTQMAAIVAGVFEVRDLMHSMQTAAQEQSQHVDQVEQAMQALEQMTEQNAALVEQSTAASAALHHQAHGLAANMRQFRTAA